MEGQTSRNPYSPSLMWVLPIACSIWIGLIVEGWFAKRIGFTLLNMLVEPIFASMVVPALTLFLAWLLLTPARIYYRLQAFGFVAISSLPIIYCSHQRPGEPPISVASIAKYYCNRHNFSQVVELSLPQAALAILTASVSLLLLDCFLTHTLFHRVPLEAKSKGKPQFNRLNDAYWNPIYGEEELSEIHRRRLYLLVVLKLVLVAVLVVNLMTANWLNVFHAIEYGVVLGAAMYLCIWVARECYRPWLSMFVLLFGAATLVCLPPIWFFNTPYFRLSGSQEYWIMTLAVGVSAMLCAASLILLKISNQMPRRGVKNKSPSIATLPSTSATIPKQISAIRFLVTGHLLWLFFLGVAYWTPLNIDAVEFTKSNKLSFDQGRLGAQLLKTTAGDRSKFKIGRAANHKATITVDLPQLNDLWMPCFNLVEQRSRGGDYCWIVIHSSVKEVQTLERLLPIASNVTGFIDLGHPIDTENYKPLDRSGGRHGTFCFGFDHRGSRGQSIELHLPTITGHWDNWVDFVENRAHLGDRCQLEVRSPILDLIWLEEALNNGISVTCSLNANRRAISPTLISTPGLRINKLHNANLSVEIWGLIESFHFRQVNELVECHLPDDLPREILDHGSANLTLKKCAVSDGLLKAMTPMTDWPRVSVTLIEPQFLQPLDAMTLTKFVYHGEVLGTPPLANPVRNCPNPLFVPTFVSEQYSRWEFSTRPMLLKSGALAEVISNPIEVPYYIGFDGNGQLTELGVVPTRDCPADAHWVTMPDVEHLYVNLVPSTYDNRKSSSDSLVVEDIGFQVSAFPKLSRITIGSHPVHYMNSSTLAPQRSIDEDWDDRYTKFLQELLKHPGVVEVTIDCAFKQDLWELLAKSEFIERLIVDAERGRSRKSPWLEMLNRFPRVSEVIVVDSALDPTRIRTDMMREYMERMLDDSPEPIDPHSVRAPAALSIPQNLDGEQFNQAHEKAMSVFLADWSRIMREYAPNVRVKIVPPKQESPEVQGQNNSSKRDIDFKSR